MHTLANERLDGFQIQLAGLAAVGEDSVGEALYLERRFLLYGFERFFSRTVRRSGSDGRKWQICALTSRKSRCRAW